jgi:putative ABC transport system permease protein
MPWFVDALTTDVRQAVRRIRQAPWLSLVVIGTLALAIAANATVLSLLKPTVLQKMQATRPDELVAVSGTDVKTGIYSAIHGAVLEPLRSGQRSLSIMSAFTSSIVRIEAGGSTVDAGVEGVEGSYFDVLGVRPRAGRLITPADDQLSPIGVLSARMAERLFGSAEAAVGRSIVADGRPLDIIGVAENGFIGTRLDGGDELFVPLRYLRGMQGADTAPRAQMLIGRLARGSTLEDARTEILGRWPGIKAGVAPTLPAPHQATLANQVITVNSFARGASGLRDRFGRSLMLVMVLAGALLAVGCVNLSALMLARALTRQHEFAVRLAMGVSSLRLFQQVIVDGMLLSLVAVMVAIPLAFWASAVLTSMVSVGRALSLGETTPDFAVMAVATAVSLAAGIAISLLPARRALRLDMDDVLRGRGLSHRIRSARTIMVTQIALSMVLVGTAGLFVTTLSNLYENDVQERTNPILFTRLSKRPLERPTVVSPSFLQTLQERLAAIPGAEGAAISENFPAYMGAFSGTMPTEPVTAGEVQTQALVDHVSPGFFDLYSITRLRGRDFTWADSESSPNVAIVAEVLARKLSPSGDVVGRHVQITSGGKPIDLEIVGVVADGPFFNIRTPNVPALFRPVAQNIRRNQTPMAAIRVNGSVAAAQQAYVDAVNAQGTYQVLGMFTMDSYVDFALIEQRLIAGMSSFAATLTMALASIGLFGMLAYSVASRMREIGIRASVGASHREVLRMILFEGLAVVVPGVAIGVPLALAAAWVVRSQLYGVSATDPRVIAMAAAVLVITSLVASWLPARRASRIQPIEALREE